ncbi:MAG: hypothetical protein B7Y84_16920 [Azorhizobium sp. 32-67-21]|nr:MAG: hypothetical protein B7Y84_16920 [Azorhizobium sp. 32-67-21]
MRCPYCGHEDTQVRDSRPTEDDTAIRRRRVCPSCNGRFTTFERVQLRELMVVKRSNELKRIDDVAYVRFASVYRNFREAKDFESVLDELAAGRLPEPVKAVSGKVTRPPE